MYAVGDVVYVISNKKRNVVPVQIVEQIVRRSLEGESVSFKAALPGKDPSKTIDLDEIDGTVKKSPPSMSLPPPPTEIDGEIDSESDENSSSSSEEGTLSTC